MVYTNVFNPQTQETEQFSNAVQYPEILRAQAGDRRAEDRFMRRNKRLVLRIANRYRGLADWNDLVAAGNWGLAHAIKKFDVSKGFKFSSYAEKPIGNEIQQFLSDKRGLTKEIAKHLKNIKEASQNLEWELERQPTLEELSERTGYSQRVINNAWDKARVVETYSLNIPVGEDLKAEQIDLVESDDDLWDYAEKISEKEYIAQLPERYNVIVRARRDGHSYRAIGRMLNLSGERIRQLFKEALAYLKHLVTYGACLVRFPQPLQVKEPEKATKPVVKRVDASRLGGRIGRAINKIFNQAKAQTIHSNWSARSNLDDQFFEKQVQSLQQLANENTDVDFGFPSRCGGDIDLATRQTGVHQGQLPRSANRGAIGGLIHAAKSILAFRRRGNHGPADRPWHQPTPADQRCCRLEQVRTAWGGYLEVGKVISASVTQPLTYAYQTIRGFVSRGSPQYKGQSIKLFVTNVFENFGIGQREDRARPPTNFQSHFSIETNRFPLGGIDMNTAKYLALVCLFLLSLFLAPELSSQSKHLMDSVAHTNVKAQEYLVDLESLSAYIDKTESEIARNGPDQSENLNFQSNTP